MFFLSFSCSPFSSCSSVLFQPCVSLFSSLYKALLKSSSAGFTKFSSHHLWQPLNLLMRLFQFLCTTPALRLCILFWFLGSSSLYSFITRAYGQVQLRPAMTRIAETQRKQKNKWMSRTHQVIERGPHVRPLTWHASWLPQWWWDRWHRQVRIGDSFSNNNGEFSIVAALAAPSGTVEASSNQVHMAVPEKESASTTADIKLFCTRLSSPARLLQGALVILVFKQTSQFRFLREIRKKPTPYHFPRTYMTGFLQNLNRHGISLFCLKSFPLCCLIPSRIFVPRRKSVLPSNGMREKTIVLFVSDLRHCFQRLPCHDWNCMSLLWKIVHVPSTENTLPLSSQRRLSFLTLCDWSSFHNIAPDPEVSSSHHLMNMKFYSCLQFWIVRLSFVSSRFLIIQSQHSLKLGGFFLVIMTCTILPGSYLSVFH